MRLAEALREAGVWAEEYGEVTAVTASEYGKLEWGPEVPRETIYARVGGRTFLVCPLWVYREGEIAEEWVVSAGSPLNIPRTIFRLRGREGSAEWVFLGRDRDPRTNKWPTFSLRDGVSRSRESRTSRP